MTADRAAQPDMGDRYARVVLSILTDPGDEVLAALLLTVPPSEVAALVMSRHEDPAPFLLRQGAEAFGVAGGEARSCAALFAGEASDGGAGAAGAGRGGSGAAIAGGRGSGAAGAGGGGRSGAIS
jgi:hypothetical protein